MSNNDWLDLDAAKSNNDSKTEDEQDLLDLMMKRNEKLKTLISVSFAKQELTKPLENEKDEESDQQVAIMWDELNINSDFFDDKHTTETKSEDIEVIGTGENYNFSKQSEIDKIKQNSDLLKSPKQPLKFEDSIKVDQLKNTFKNPISNDINTMLKMTEFGDLDSKKEVRDGTIKLRLKNPPRTPKNNLHRIPVTRSIDSNDSSFATPSKGGNDLKQYHDFVMKTFEKLQKQISNNHQLPKSNVEEVISAKNEVQRFYQNMTLSMEQKPKTKSRSSFSQRSFSDPRSSFKSPVTPVVDDNNVEYVACKSGKKYVPYGRHLKARDQKYKNYYGAKQRHNQYDQYYAGDHYDRYDKDLELKAYSPFNDIAFGGVLMPE